MLFLSKQRFRCIFERPYKADGSDFQGSDAEYVYAVKVVNIQMIVASSVGV
jgi:hypothetical protein